MYKDSTFFSSKLNFGTVVSGLVSEFFSRTLVGLPGSCASCILLLFSGGVTADNARTVQVFFGNQHTQMISIQVHFIHWRVFYTALRKQYFESSVFSD